MLLQTLKQFCSLSLPYDTLELPSCEDATGMCMASLRAWIDLRANITRPCDLMTAPGKNLCLNSLRTLSKQTAHLLLSLHHTNIYNSGIQTKIESNMSGHAKIGGKVLNSLLQGTQSQLSNCGVLKPPLIE